jgi:hypothetical protein
MLHLTYRIVSLALLAWMFALPVFAQSTPGGLENPLKFESVEGFVEGFLRAIVMIALPLITIFIVYAGFLFISARGKPGQLNEAKNNFTYVIMGAILILSAWVLATLIGGTIRQLLG